MKIKLSKRHLAVFAVLLAHVIWGSAPPIFKWSLGSIEPLTLGFLRFFFGTIILLPFTYRDLHVRNADISKLAIGAFFSGFLNIGLYYVGLNYAPSINVTIIGAAGPIFILIASGRFFHERVSAKILYGTLFSLLGVIVIILRPLLEQSSFGNLTGNILYLLSTLASLPYYFVLKNIINEYSVAKLTFWLFFFCQIFFLPAFLWEVYQPGYTFLFSWQAFIGIFYGAVFSSAIAWFVYAFALRYLLTSEVTIFTYLDPVFTAMVAITLVGETITFSYLLGAVLVFAGIFIAEGRFRHHQPIHHHRMRHL